MSANKGASVTNYVLVKLDVLNLIHNVEVQKRSSKSDNAPIYARVKLPQHVEAKTTHARMLKMGNWMLPPTKNNQHKFISTSWVHDICKWFARWHIEEHLDVDIDQMIRTGSTLETQHTK